MIEPDPTQEYEVWTPLPAIGTVQHYRYAWSTAEKCWQQFFDHRDGKGPVCREASYTPAEFSQKLSKPDVFLDEDKALRLMVRELRKIARDTRVEATVWSTAARAWEEHRLQRRLNTVD